MKINKNLVKEACFKPRFSRPMLLSSQKINPKSLFSNKKWIFERKYDGFRCIVVKDEQGRVRLLSRNYHNYTKAFPELVEEFKKQEGSFVVDGEIISDSFYDLVSRFRRKTTPVQMNIKPVQIQLFDIIHNNGLNIKKVALVDRKKYLRECISFNRTIQYVKPLKKNSYMDFKRLKQNGWEGVVAKNLNGIYQNSRSLDLIKFVFLRSKFLTVCGFKTFKKRRGMVRSLILGKGKRVLKYAGSVQVGTSRINNILLRKRLSNHLSKTPVLEISKRKSRGIHWIKPKKKVQVTYLMKTNRGFLRSPSLKASRDKIIELRRKNIEGLAR